MEFSEFSRRVGENVRRARWLRGLTQAELAARGFHHRYYQELERGRRNPSLRTLFELAVALEVSVADLVDVGEPRLIPPLAERELVGPRRGRKKGGR